MLLDGQHTGRFRWDQLYKTEKAHAGTLIEINLQREFGFGDGLEMDYRIAGIDVDCKFSQTRGAWMIPPEAAATCSSSSGPTTPSRCGAPDWYGPIPEC